MRNWMRIFVAVTGLASASAAVFAAGEDQVAFELRRDTMKAMGRDLYTGVGRAVKGRAAFGPDTAVAAEAVVKRAAALGTLFPPGSAVAGSGMKPELLADRPRVDALITAVQAAAPQLAAAVGSGDKAKIAAAYKALNDACEACHTSFRKDE